MKDAAESSGKYWSEYIRRKSRYYLAVFLVSAAYQAYFLLLMRDRHLKYLIYLDFLLVLGMVVFAAVDYGRFRMEQREWELEAEEHRKMETGLERAREENCELQDYVARWCHEVKVPLAAGLLLGENIEEPQLRNDMREQLERMKQQLNSMLSGCRLQSTLLDVQIKPVLLSECVKKSIGNNQFFLIHGGFSLDIRVENLTVYTDFSWLVYILDQLLNNAVKYAGNQPVLLIWSEKQGRSVRLFVEDHGEGIRQQDIRRIFEKGFTGTGQHNGSYKSTGMGLYMVSRIAGRLGHSIQVESEYGSYTRFCIGFEENDYYRL